MNATEFNRPQTGYGFSNAKGQKLHFRIDWNNFEQAKYLVFYIHGYGGHGNRVEMHTMSQYFNEHGATVVLMDQIGHGYSEGERVLMLDHNDLVDDFSQLICCLMDKNKSKEALLDEMTFDSSVGSFQYENLPQLRELPCFVMGGSMGGAVSLLTAHRLSADEQFKNLAPTFRGALLMAPALSFKLPHWLMVETLRYTVGTCAPAGFMPEFLNNVGNNSLTFKSEEVLARNEKDSYGLYEGALGWNGLMRWGTALMFINMAPAIQVLMPEVKFPFLLLHDPGDEICDIEGSRMLYKLSATSEDKKDLVELPGYLHGLIYNENEDVCRRCLEFMKKVT
mmetsp:Transcript_15817/g.26444  ORF Transcript_15817/g.26444 Transcript_15817/m.26444 type:complete len:337 (-) Transcript_15817:674-1684(-)